MTAIRYDWSMRSRREVLAGLLAGATAWQLHGQEPLTIPGKGPMLVHNDRPEDLETPGSAFQSWLTPNHLFFVRQHIPRPQIEAGSFQIQFSGRVAKPMAINLADLRKLPQQQVAATLECTGNARGLFRPRVPGIQWGRGAIGNAEWSGPRLSDVLKMAGADLNAQYVTTNAADNGVAKTPDFIRSLPMKKALHPATLLALGMNGAPLPELHGFPLRLIVPGWDGTSWVKWVNSVSIDNEADKGFFMNPAYRFPKHPGPPGLPAKPADLEVIEGMPVQSFIMSHTEGAKVPKTAATLSGIAMAGEERVMRVEVSTDSGRSWKNAELSPQNLPFAWRLWSMPWTPPDYGYYTVMSRATDSTGRIQPIVATWNPSGYLYNAIDQVGITVESAS